jgi:hypothetical protein
LENEVDQKLISKVGREIFTVAKAATLTTIALALLESEALTWSRAGGGYTITLGLAETLTCEKTFLEIYAVIVLVVVFSRLHHHAWSRRNITAWEIFRSSKKRLVMRRCR